MSDPVPIFRYSGSGAYARPRGVLRAEKAAGPSLRPLAVQSVFSDVAGSFYTSGLQSAISIGTAEGPLVFDNGLMFSRKYSSPGPMFSDCLDDFYRDRRYGPQSAPFYSDIDSFYFNNRKYNRGSDPAFGVFNEFVPVLDDEVNFSRETLLRPSRRARGKRR